MILIKLIDHISNPNTFFYEVKINDIGSAFYRLTDADCVRHRSSIDDVIYKYALEFAEKNNFKHERVVYV
jgi:hypothetical protein